MHASNALNNTVLTKTSLVIYVCALSASGWQWAHAAQSYGSLCEGVRFSLHMPLRFALHTVISLKECLFQVISIIFKCRY